MGTRFSLEEVPPPVHRPRSKRYRDTVINDNGRAHLGDLYVQGDVHYHRSSSKRIERKIEALVVEFRKQQSHESVITHESLSTCNAEDWRILRKYLKRYGITGRMMRDYQDFIVKLFEPDAQKGTEATQGDFSLSRLEQSTRIETLDLSGANSDDLRHFGKDKDILGPPTCSETVKPGKVVIWTSTFDRDEMDDYFDALLKKHHNRDPHLHLRLVELYQDDSNIRYIAWRKHIKSLTKICAKSGIAPRWANLPYIWLPRQESFPPWLTTSPFPMDDHVKLALSSTRGTWESLDYPDNPALSLSVCYEKSMVFMSIFSLIPYGMTMIMCCGAVWGNANTVAAREEVRKPIEVFKNYLAQELVFSKISGFQLATDGFLALERFENAWKTKMNVLIIEPPLMSTAKTPPVDH